MIHHVFENLTAAELLCLRSASARLRDIVASNSYWFPCFLRDLLGTFAAFNGIAAIPSHLRSFSLVPDGWHRAYYALMCATREP